MNIRFIDGDGDRIELRIKKKNLELLLDGELVTKYSLDTPDNFTAQVCVFIFLFLYTVVGGTTRGFKYTNPGTLWSHPLKYFLSHLSIFVLSLLRTRLSHIPWYSVIFSKKFFSLKFYNTGSVTFHLPFLIHTYMVNGA